MYVYEMTVKQRRTKECPQLVCAIEKEIPHALFSLFLSCLFRFTLFLWFYFCVLANPKFANLLIISPSPSQ